ncbi:MAG: TusE/DsrC/DsvC family sulfur relay protein [Planctomycetota bacterium]|jgi:tRNA 2-thiouridine synthesizing protein E
MSRVSIKIEGSLYRLDNRGFLDPPGQWDETFAEGMARETGIQGGLTPEHWRFIQYLRKAFLLERTVPAIFHACAENKMRLDRFRSLFPAGYLRGACRIAGVNYASIADRALWLSYEHVPVIEQ